MNKRDVADVLDEIGTLLELRGEVVFKTRAYENGARTIRGLEGDLADMVADGSLGQVKGIGKGLFGKIKELVETGRLDYYEALKREFPEGVRNMLRIPGMGPKKVKAVYEKLGIQNMGELRYACLENRLRDLSGFGAKTQQNVLQGIDFLSTTADRFLFSTAFAVAESVRDALTERPEVRRIAVAGSVRRCKETVHDIDVLASSDTPEPVMAAFVALPEVARVAAHGRTKSSVVFETGIAADLRVVTDAQFPFALHYFTGSKEHNIAMRGLAQKRGLKLNEYGLFRGASERSLRCDEEADIFAALDLAYIPPELREDNGEIDAAAAHEIPRLIERSDLRGTFHCHTIYSDGSATIEEMVEAARALGFSYLGITEHSHSAAYAGGLSEADIRKQHREIDALNKKLDGFRVLKGIESDIKGDGRLDYSDAVLGSFDFVIASVHSQFNLSAADMTARLVAAVANPYTTILGHPTGRLLLARDEYAVDMPTVIRAAAEHGKAIEINANPHRLDLDWRYGRMARDLGVSVAICPDAHHPDGLSDVDYGVNVARKGWLRAEDVMNTREVDDLLDAWRH